MKKNNLGDISLEWLTVERQVFQNTTLLILMSLSLYLDVSKVFEASNVPTRKKKVQ